MAAIGRTQARDARTCITLGARAQADRGRGGSGGGGADSDAEGDGVTGRKHPEGAWGGEEGGGRGSGMGRADGLRVTWLVARAEGGVGRSIEGGGPDRHVVK